MVEVIDLTLIKIQKELVSIDTQELLEYSQSTWTAEELKDVLEFMRRVDNISRENGFN